MTWRDDRRITSGKVLPFPNSRYAQWRLEGGGGLLLHEQGESPPEHLLQAIWQHQRLRRNQLESVDGQRVRILHPGFLNREGGPDFRSAVLQLGDNPPRSGDIEVDIRPSGWHAHGHDRNPAFSNVLLHVIWDGEPERRGATRVRRENPISSQAPRRPQGAEVPPAPTMLALRHVLDAPIGELSLWLNSEAAAVFPENLRGRCGPALREFTADELSRLLHEAAQIRFQTKAEQVQARARQAGWEQALWEALFRALGYKHNGWPMQCLAEQRARWWEQKLPVATLQARLLGLSGLLPGELNRGRQCADAFLRRAWDQWWREREEFAECTLPRSLWRLHGQRPANHPQRRLALAAHWLARRDFIHQIERWCAAPLPDRRLTNSLLEVLQTARDEVWSWHWTMRSARLNRPQPLIGLTRVTDLAVNAILPWLWVRATEGGNTTLQQTIEHRFRVWPRAEDNAVLRLARQRLLQGTPFRNLRTAAEQQGLIQITRDFCDRSNALCENCQFPERLGSLGSVNSKVN